LHVVLLPQVVVRKQLDVALLKWHEHLLILARVSTKA
jgi:hypothetical protein